MKIAKLCFVMNDFMGTLVRRCHFAHSSFITCSSIRIIQVNQLSPVSQKYNSLSSFYSVSCTTSLMLFTQNGERSSRLGYAFVKSSSRFRSSANVDRVDPHCSSLFGLMRYKKKIHHHIFLECLVINNNSF